MYSVVCWRFQLARCVDGVVSYGLRWIDNNQLCSLIRSLCHWWRNSTCRRKVCWIFTVGANGNAQHPRQWCQLFPLSMLFLYETRSRVFYWSGGANIAAGLLRRGPLGIPQAVHWHLKSFDWNASRQVSTSQARAVLAWYSSLSSTIIKCLLQMKPFKGKILRDMNKKLTPLRISSQDVFKFSHSQVIYEY